MDIYNTVVHSDLSSEIKNALQNLCVNASIMEHEFDCPSIASQIRDDIQTLFEHLQETS